MLIVDDYTDVRLTLEIALQRLGYDVRAVPCLVAIDVMSEFAPHAIVVEVAPATYDLVRQLVTVRGEIPMIGMSRDNADRTLREVLADVLVKPFSIEELQRALDRQLLS